MAVNSLEVVRPFKSCKWNTHFHRKVSNGKTGLPFQKFRLFRKISSGTNQKRVFHLHPNRNFRNFLVNGKRPMLVSSPNPPGIELYYHANVFFCFRCKNKVTDHVNENTTNAKQLKQYSFSSSDNFESHHLHEICFKEKKSIVHGIVYRQHNSPEQFLNISMIQ